MEKIYMSNNNKKSIFQKAFDGNISITISFVLAFIGVFSILAFSFSQISFAIPDVQDPLPEKFTTVETEYQQAIIGESSQFPVTPYFAVVDGSNVPVFCLEHDITFCDGTEYTRDNSMIDDAGLLYLMANLYPNVDLKYNGTIVDTKVQTWVTQTAIWIYLKETGYPNQTKLDTAMITAIKNEFKLYLRDDEGTTLTDGITGSLYTVLKSNQSTITQLIDKAKTLKGQAALNLNIAKASEKISITSDNKYYQTDEITISGSVSDSSIGSFNGYKLEFKNAPSGTMIVDAEGNEIKDLSNLAANTKFFIRVPVDKVTEEFKNIAISVTGSFKSYTGSRYTAQDCQTITTVKTVNNNISKPLDIEINYTPDVPDTGMSAAQSIYFIGLIVLLSGVGIIYANVKPTKSN